MRDLWENDPSFSIYDFKKWLGDSIKETKIERCVNKVENKDLVGNEVVPRLGMERLIEHIKNKNELKEDEAKLIAKEFKENSGFIKDADGLDLIVECKSKSFSILKGSVTFPSTTGTLKSTLTKILLPFIFFRSLSVCIFCYS